jgi:hypothetical protein
MSKLNAVLHDMIVGINADLATKPLFTCDYKRMLDVLNELRSDPLAIPTNSWNERQILLSHIIDAGLDTDPRDGLLQRALKSLEKEL